MKDGETHENVRKDLVRLLDIMRECAICAPKRWYFKDAVNWQRIAARELQCNPRGRYKE
jgi:hypothetical protein